MWCVFFHLAKGMKWKRKNVALLRIVFSIMFFDCLTTISLSHCCLIKETTMVNQHREKNKKPITTTAEITCINECAMYEQEKIYNQRIDVNHCQRGPALVHNGPAALIPNTHSASKQTNERKKSIPRVIKNVNTRKLECLFCARPFIYCRHNLCGALCK